MTPEQIQQQLDLGMASIIRVVSGMVNQIMVDIQRIQQLEAQLAAEKPVLEKKDDTE